MNAGALLFLFFQLYLPSSVGEGDHAIYISVLEIDNQQMKVKVFTDNLDDALRSTSSSVDEYFHSKIKLQINEEDLNFNLLEVSEEGDSYWITFGLEAPEEWHSFHLEASYLMELFPSQINVIKVLNGKPQFFRLSKLNPSCSFSSE